MRVIFFSEIEEALNKQRLRHLWSLIRQANGAAIRGRLKYAVGTIGRWVARLGLTMMMVSIPMVRRVDLLKKVMHPVGRRVEKKK
jgi:hypothetical protein